MPSNPSFDLAGVRVLVTGAGRGLGRGIAAALADWGALVHATDVHADNIAETEAQIRGAGGTASSGIVDVADEASVDAAVANALSVLGGIDLLVNNAGVISVCTVIDMTLADWKRVLDVNATGTFLVSRAVARHMVDAGGGGSIVSIASIGGKVGDPKLAHYSASKFAIVGFTQALARELGEHDITVNAVCPGVVETQMIDLLAKEWSDGQGELTAIQAIDRPQTPIDIAGAIAFLHQARSITGQAINVDGGTVFH